VTTAPESRVAAPADRITVALVPKAAAGLKASQERSGLSKTEITNRALTLHEFVTAQIEAGMDLLIRDPASGETQLVKLI